MVCLFMEGRDGKLTKEEQRWCVVLERVDMLY